MFTRFLTCLILIAGFSQAQNSKAPEIFDGLLTKDKAVKAQIGMVVYRAQELTSAGTRLLDKSLVIRFPIAAKKP